MKKHILLFLAVAALSHEAEALDLIFKGTLPLDLVLVGKEPSQNQLGIAVFVEGALLPRWAVAAGDPLIKGSIARLTVSSAARLLRIEIRSPGRRTVTKNNQVTAENPSRWTIDLGTITLQALPLPVITALQFADSRELRQYKLTLTLVNDQNRSFDVKEIAIRLDASMAFNYQGVGGDTKQFRFDQEIALTSDSMIQGAIAVGNDSFRRPVSGRLSMAPAADMMSVELVIDLRGYRIAPKDQGAVEIVLPMSFILDNAAPFLSQYKEFTGVVPASNGRAVTLDIYKHLDAVTARLRFAEPELGELVKTLALAH